LKCVDVLTIEDTKSLQTKVEDLANKSKDNEYLVNAKLSEKDKQIEALMQKQNQFEQLIQSLIDSGQLKPTLSNTNHIIWRNIFRSYFTHNRRVRQGSRK
jgi:hypothetical protein